MDKCSPCGSSMYQGGNSDVICDSVSTEGSSVQIQSTGLRGKLQINDGNIMNTNDMFQFPVKGHSIEEEEEEEDDDDIFEEELLAQMGYVDSKPKRHTRESQGQHCTEEAGTSDHVKNETPMHKRITAPMTDIKLVSALKGSREKQGNSGNECRVSWAPDVYDPSPSAEYFALNGPERHESENEEGIVVAKNRQKVAGKGARTNQGRSKGGKAAGKDKKQAKKQAGRGSKFPDYSEY